MTDETKAKIAGILALFASDCVATVYEMNHMDKKGMDVKRLTMSQAREALEQLCIQERLAGIDIAFDSHDYDGMRKIKVELQSLLKGKDE